MPNSAYLMIKESDLLAINQKLAAAETLREENTRIQKHYDDLHRWHAELASKVGRLRVRLKETCDKNTAQARLIREQHAQLCALRTKNFRLSSEVQRRMSRINARAQAMTFWVARTLAQDNARCRQLQTLINVGLTTKKKRDKVRILSQLHALVGENQTVLLSKRHLVLNMYRRKFDIPENTFRQDVLSVSPTGRWIGSDLALGVPFGGGYPTEEAAQTDLYRTAARAIYETPAVRLRTSRRYGKSAAILGNLFHESKVEDPAVATAHFLKNCKPVFNRDPKVTNHDVQAVNRIDYAAIEERILANHFAGKNCFEKNDGPLPFPVITFNVTGSGDASLVNMSMTGANLRKLIDEINAARTRDKNYNCERTLL